MYLHSTIFSTSLPGRKNTIFRGSSSLVNSMTVQLARSMPDNKNYGVGRSSRTKVSEKVQANWDRAQVLQWMKWMICTAPYKRLNYDWKMLLSPWVFILGPLFISFSFHLHPYSSLSLGYSLHTPSIFPLLDAKWAFPTCIFLLSHSSWPLIAYGHLWSSEFNLPSFITSHGWSL